MIVLVGGLVWAGSQALRRGERPPFAPTEVSTETPTQAPTATAGATAPPSPTAVAVAPTARPPASPPPPQPTPPPAPTPVPTAGPERVIERVSKVGVGVYYKGGNFVRYETFKAKPGVILLMDPDVEFVRELRRLFPKAIIIGRRNWNPQPLDNPRQRGEAYADFVAQLAMPVKGLVDAWASYNEPVRSGDLYGYRAYNEFQVAFAERMRDQYGLDAVAGNDAPGAIDIPEYPQYFAEAIRASKYLGVHAYTKNKATTFNEQDKDWYMLRYRKIHDALEADGIRDVKIILTEAALTGGWQGLMSAEQIGNEYLWLADEMYKDPYALGYAAYGIWLDAGQWGRYQLAGAKALEMMGAYQPPGQR